MIDRIVIPTDVDFSKRHEPTGAIVARRITGDDSAIVKADRAHKFGENRDFKQHPPTRGEKALGYGALAAIPVSAVAGAKGGQALMRRSYRRRLEATVSGTSYTHHPASRSLLSQIAPMVSKGLLAPTNKGPVKKAPTLARTGGQQPKSGTLVRTAQLADDPIRLAARAVTKANRKPLTRGQMIRRGAGIGAGTLGATGMLVGGPRMAVGGAVQGGAIGGLLGWARHDGEAERKRREDALVRRINRQRSGSVGKALGPQTLEAAYRDMRGQRDALASSLERHTGVRGAERRAAHTSLRGANRRADHYANRMIRNKKLAIGTGAGGLLVGAAGGRMSKAYRSFDPEDARQRRLGAMAAGSALSGGVLIRSGGKQIRRDSRALGEHVRGARETVEVEHNKRQLLNRVGELPDKRMALVRLKSGGKVAGGAALLGAAGQLMSDRHKKPWR